MTFEWIPKVTLGDIFSAVAPVVAFFLGMLHQKRGWHKEAKDEVYQPLREGVKAKKEIIKEDLDPSLTGIDPSVTKKHLKGKEIVKNREYLVDKDLRDRWKKVSNLREELRSNKEELTKKFKNEIKEDFINYFVKANNNNKVVKITTNPDGQKTRERKEKIENWQPVNSQWKPDLYILREELTSAQKSSFGWFQKLSEFEPDSPEELLEDLKGIVIEHKEAKRFLESYDKSLKEANKLQKDLENYFLKGVLKRYYYYLKN